MTAARQTAVSAIAGVGAGVAAGASVGAGPVTAAVVLVGAGGLVLALALLAAAVFTAREEPMRRLLRLVRVLREPRPEATGRAAGAQHASRRLGRVTRR